MEINNELITYETAKLAKEKDFNEFDSKHNYVFCEKLNSTFYHKPVQNNHVDSYNVDYIYRAPTQSLLQRWLRETHKILIIVSFYTEEDLNDIDIIKYIVRVSEPNTMHEMEIFVKSDFNTWEQALEVGLFEGLKLIK